VRRWYSLAAPSIVPDSHWPALPFVTRPTSMASTLPARALDAGDQLVLHAQGAHEPVEAGGDDDVGLARLDGAAQPRAPFERGRAGDVELVDGLDEHHPVALAGGGHTIALLGRAHERLARAAAGLADADDADRPRVHDAVEAVLIPTNLDPAKGQP
jgi:hypothetical protein